MPVLQGYTYGPINCGNCGSNYIAIEETYDPEVVILRCWSGCTATAPRDHELVVKALGKSNEDEASNIKCPAPGCDVSLDADDLPGQIAHVQSQHPEIIASRQQESRRQDAWA
jgi:hypothetical protein